MKIEHLFLLLAFLCLQKAEGQSTWQNLDTVKAPTVYDHVYSVKLYGDTLVTSFLFFIKDEVKNHFHDEHSEHIYVLAGTAMMTLDGKTFSIKKGDFIFVPMQKRHSVKVTSAVPLKVISIQAPWFDGKDRLVVK
jgi:mannose-6-phosphate isomerase-like protein (cupin superfamily)